MVKTSMKRASIAALIALAWLVVAAPSAADELGDYYVTAPGALNIRCQYT